MRPTFRRRRRQADREEPAEGPARPAQERASAAGAFRRGDAGLAAARGHPAAATAASRHRASASANCRNFRPWIASACPTMPRGGGIASRSPRWRRSSRTSAATASWPSTRCGGCRRSWPRSIARWNSLRACSRPRKNTSRPSRRAWGGAECRANSGKRWPRPACWWTMPSRSCRSRGSGGWTSWTPPARRPGSSPRPDGRFRRQQEALDEARQATGAWRQKLPAAEVPLAIEQAKAFEQSLFAWLRPAWWRLRRILNRSYDFRSHVVRPRWSQVLAALQKEYEELDKLDRRRKAIAEQFRLEGDVDGLIAHVYQLRTGDPRPGPVARPDPRRVGEGRQGAADRRQDRRGRRASPLAGRRTGQDPAPARGQSAR